MGRQRTQLINAIRGHLAEYGWVAPWGQSHVAVLADLLDGEMGLLEVLDSKITELDETDRATRPRGCDCQETDDDTGPGPDHPPQRLQRLPAG